MDDTMYARIKAVLATVECNHDDNETVLGYCVVLGAAIEAPVPDVHRAKAALVSIATALEGRVNTAELVDEIDDIVEVLG